MRCYHGHAIPISRGIASEVVAENNRLDVERADRRATRRRSVRRPRGAAAVLSNETWILDLETYCIIEVCRWRALDLVCPPPLTVGK